MDELAALAVPVHRVSEYVHVWRALGASGDNGMFRPRSAGSMEFWSFKQDELTTIFRSSRQYRE
jgi:hypothetical protein